MLLPCLLVSLLLLALALARRRSHKFTDLHKQIPVDYPYLPFVGHGYKFIGNNEDRMRIMDELGRQAQRSVHGAVSCWVANFMCVFVAEGAAAGVVLRASCDKWIVSDFSRHLAGDGSVFGREEIWRGRRKVLSQIFGPKYVGQSLRVLERRSTALLRSLAGAGAGDESVWPHFSAYTMRSALEMIFGENLKAERDASEQLLQAFGEYAHNLGARVCQVWLYSNAVYRRLPVHARQRRCKSVVWRRLENLIALTKQSMAKKRLEQQQGASLATDANELDAEYKPLMELMIELTGGDNGYTDVELREEAVVLVLAASDTTATAACFASVLLANHPREQHRVYEEIQEILGGSERPLTAEDLPNLKYLDAVVKETLRLYPSKPFTMRKCTQDIQLPSGLVLPEGCGVVLHFWGMHRDPRCWGADADQFRPERFLSATPDQLAAFMPFGHGPRYCLGSRLALSSLKLSLAQLARRFRLAPAAGYGCSAAEPLRVSYDITLKHVHDFKVQLRARP